MARIRLDLDIGTFERLTEAAVAERRPVDWQAAVLLERALGTRPPEAPFHAAIADESASRPSEAVPDAA